MAGQSGAIRAGKAYFEMVTDTKKFTADLANVKAQVMQLGAFFKSVGSMASSFGTSITSPLTSVLKQTVGYGASVNALSKQFNVSTQTISALGAGMEGAGVSFSEFAGVLDMIGSKLTNNDSLFQELGLYSRQLAGLPIDEAMGKIFDAISQIPSPMKQSAIAVEMFGTAGKNMLPFIREGAAGLRRMKEEGRDAMIDPETAEKSTEALRGMNRVFQLVQQSIISVGSALLPTREEIKQTIANAKQIASGFRTWVTENKNVIKTVLAIGGGMVIAGTAIIGLGTAISIAGSAVGGMVSVVSGLVAGVTALATPAGAALAALGGFVYLLSTSGAAKTTIDSLKEGFAGMADTAVTAFQGIKDALLGGNIDGAFAIIVKSMDILWLQLVDSMKSSWDSFSFDTGKTMVGAIDGLRIMWIEFSAWLSKAVLAPIFRTFLDNAADAVDLFDSDMAQKMRDKSASISDAEIDAKRDRQTKEIMQENTATENRAKLGHEKPPENSQIAVLRDQLKALIEEMKASKQQGGPFGLAFGPAFQAALSQIQQQGSSLPDLFSRTKGGFGSTAAAQQFAVSDTIPQRQLFATQRIADHTRELPSIRAEVAALASGLTFK
jgi:hypothetical protein